MAKTSTSGQGRPKGALNKATREIKELLRGSAEEIAKELVRLCMGAENETTRVAAIKEYNDRMYGKPFQQVEVGKPGDFEDMSDHELVDLIRDAEAEAGIGRTRRSRAKAPPESESLH